MDEIFKLTNRILLYIGLFIAIIIAIVLPFIFKDSAESINQTINLSATIISSIAAVLTFIIALFLFNKYGVESPLVEKSTSKVFALLEQIKETTFSISNDRFGFWIKMSDPFKYSPRIEQFYGEKLIFSEDYIYALDKLFEIGNNPFTPPSISQKLDQLQFFVMSYDINENNIRDYAKILVVGYKKFDNPKFGRFNAEDITVFEFLKILDEISYEVRLWIQNNSTIPVQLNM